MTIHSARVIRSLEQVIEWRGKPHAIRCDKGPEYLSVEFTRWAANNDIKLSYIQPGKPTQNAYVERFNRTVRHEWLDLYLWRRLQTGGLHSSCWKMRSEGVLIAITATSRPSCIDGRPNHFASMPAKRALISFAFCVDR